MRRLSFLSRLRQYLFRNMLDRGSFDFRVIGGRGSREEDPAGSDGSESGGWSGKNRLGDSNVDGGGDARRVDLFGNNLFSGCFDKIGEEKKIPTQAQN